MNPARGKRTFRHDDDDGKPAAKWAKQQSHFHVIPLQGNAAQSRRTNDEIHSSIDMGPVISAIVDTPQFQRLRRIKQLGTAEYVYCNTNHNRFEHSLGVYFLAGRMCTRIRTKQPQLPCTPKDVLCVELAGLLHDIGHGPFSHIYESFLKYAHPTFLNENPDIKAVYDEHLPSFDVKKWKHEEVSLKMIDAALAYMGLAIDINNLDQPLKQIGDGIDTRSMRVFDSGLSDKEAILTSRDFVFVKECIYGGPIAQAEHGNPNLRTLIGRSQEKEWMYDIVSNAHSGLDVDKMDYFARDQRRAFGTSGKVHIQMIEDCYVAWGACTRPGKCDRCNSFVAPDESVEGLHLMICYGEKIEKSAINFFKERLNLHESIYRHKTVQAVAYMIQDIFSLADPYLRISTQNKFAKNAAMGQSKKEYEFLPMSLAILDAHAFERMADSIIDQIESMEDIPGLEKAKALIQRLRCRDLYKCKGSHHISLSDPGDKNIWEKSEAEIKNDIILMNAKHDNGAGPPLVLTHQDFIVEKCSINHGSGPNNPLDKMRFIRKIDEAKLNNPPVMNDRLRQPKNMGEALPNNPIMKNCSSASDVLPLALEYNKAK